MCNRHRFTCIPFLPYRAFAMLPSHTMLLTRHLLALFLIVTVIWRFQLISFPNLLQRLLHLPPPDWFYDPINFRGPSLSGLLLRLPSPNQSLVVVQCSSSPLVRRANGVHHISPILMSSMHYTTLSRLALRNKSGSLWDMAVAVSAK